MFCNTIFSSFCFYPRRGCTRFQQAQYRVSYCIIILFLSALVFEGFVCLAHQFLPLMLGYVISVGHSFNQIITCNLLQLRLYLHFYETTRWSDYQNVRFYHWIVKSHWTWTLFCIIIPATSCAFNSMKKLIWNSISIFWSNFDLNLSKHDVTWSFPVNEVSPLIIKLIQRWLSLFLSIKSKLQSRIIFTFLSIQLAFSLDLRLQECLQQFFLYCLGLIL